MQYPVIEVISVKVRNVSHAAVHSSVWPCGSGYARGPAANSY